MQRREPRFHVDIGQKGFQAIEFRSAAVDGLQGAATIGYLRSGHGGGMGQFLRVKRDVLFDAGYLRHCIVSRLFAAIGILHALCIDNQKTGYGVASPFLASPANRFS